MRFFIYDRAAFRFFSRPTERIQLLSLSLSLSRFRRKRALSMDRLDFYSRLGGAYTRSTWRECRVRGALLVERSAISGFCPLTTPSVAYPCPVWPTRPRGRLFRSPSRPLFPRQTVETKGRADFFLLVSRSKKERSDGGKTYPFFFVRRFHKCVENNGPFQVVITMDVFRREERIINEFLNQRWIVPFNETNS